MALLALRDIKARPVTEAHKDIKDIRVLEASRDIKAI
jgi:hypothetical protein